MIIPPITGIELALGIDESKIPAREDIPSEFVDGWKHNPWCKVAESWFFDGMDADTVTAKNEDVDVDAALRAVGALLRSWTPKHEHKIAVAGWWLSTWFDDVDVRGDG
jgi:hypothetical protein